ncbi:MAG: polysaccharide deacetylase family protein [Oligoflexales bacterium]
MNIMGSIKSTSKSTFANLAYHTFYRHKKFEGNRVLLYHSIGTKLNHDSYGICISKSMFRRHVKNIAKTRFKVTPLPFKLNKNSFPKSEMTISISFDDGYQDNLSAAEILSDYNLPFTIFVISDLIGKSTYLNNNQLEELSRLDLCQIGSHTASHRRLAQLSSQEQYCELKESKNRLEEIIQKDIKLLSYPHGSHSKVTMDIAKKCGYSFAYSSINGINNTNTLDQFAMRRTEILGSHSEKDLNRRIKGYEDWYAFKNRIDACK